MYLENEFHKKKLRLHKKDNVHLFVTFGVSLNAPAKVLQIIMLELQYHAKRKVTLSRREAK